MARIPDERRQDRLGRAVGRQAHEHRTVQLAHRQGLGDQEEKLREQIRWALPVEDFEPIEPA